MSREAMQMALEALCCVRDMVSHPDNLDFIDKHTAALRERLAQPEQEREWVGLTADEIWKCNKASGSAVEFHICYAHQNVEDFAEAIEAKLKEKNT